MNRKIEIIQDEENIELWHWIILEYNLNSKSWYSVRHGLEKSYIAASSIAKKEYDLLNYR